MGMDIAKFETEMNRGFLQVLVLVVLEREMYGYLILRFLEESGYPVEESTLYPLLRRLEKYGLVRSRWQVTDDRPKKYYIVSAAGRTVRKRLLAKWKHQDTILAELSTQQEER